MKQAEESPVSLSGILVIDKERGLTSHDVVARVRRITGERKAGHTGTLDPAATGVSLLVENTAGDDVLVLTIPPGAHWIGRRGRWLYRDRAGSVGGVRKLVIADATRGGVPGVDVRVSGRNGSYPLVFADLPLAVTILLGDATAGQAGSCGRRSGTRLVCH